MCSIMSLLSCWGKDRYKNAIKKAVTCVAAFSVQTIYKAFRHLSDSLQKADAFSEASACLLLAHGFVEHHVSPNHGVTVHNLVKNVSYFFHNRYPFFFS